MEEHKQVSPTEGSAEDSRILGGALGSLSGKMSKAQFKRASIETERVMDAMHDYVDFSYRSKDQSLSAASTDIDLTLRNEGRFQKISAIPVLRAAVRSDPVLRALFSPLSKVRATLVDLVDTPSQYAVNDQDVDVRSGHLAVEGAIMMHKQICTKNGRSIFLRELFANRRAGFVIEIWTLFVCRFGLAINL